ncbi:hypothetical protein BH11PLA1_BH11PLA1_10480 [soil metagenome]
MSNDHFSFDDASSTGPASGHGGSADAAPLLGAEGMLARTGGAGAGMPGMEGLGDGGLGFIASIQGQLAELGKIASDTARRSLELDQREATLMAKQAEVQRARESAGAELTELARRQQQAEDEQGRRQVALEQRGAELERLQKDVKEKLREAGELEAKRAEAQSALAALDAAENQLAAERRALAQDRAAMEQTLTEESARLHGQSETLAAREARAVQRMSELEVRGARLETETAEIEAQKATLNARLEALSAQEEEVASRERALVGEGTALAAREDDLNRERASLMQQIADIEGGRTALQREREQAAGERAEQQRHLEGREKTVTQRLAALQRQADALDEERVVVSAERSAAETLVKQAEQMRMQAEAQLEEARGLASASRAESERAAAALREEDDLKRRLGEESARRAQLEGAVARLEDSVVELRRETDEARRGGEALQQELGAARLRTVELEAQAKAAAERGGADAQFLVEQLAAVQTQVGAGEASIHEMKQAAAERDERMQTLMDAAAEAGARLEASVQQTARLRGELNAAHAAAEAKVTLLSGTIEASSLRALEFERAATKARAEAQETRSAALAEAQRIGAALAAALDDCAEAKSERDGAHADAGRWRDELDAARAAGVNSGADHKAMEAAQRRVKELGEQIVKREDAIRHLSTRLEAAETRATEAEEAALTAQRRVAEERGGSVSDEDRPIMERVQLRHARLARYKKLLSGQAHKIVKAKAALQKRSEAYDELLREKARIIEGATALKRERALVQMKLAKSQSAGMVFFLAASLAVVGGMAWAAATQMAPATFAARTTLAADGKGNTLTDEDLKGWTSAHERMLEDPAYMQLAAERFAQRGMSALGNAPAVSDRVKKDVSYQTDAAGKLTLEMRGEGSERTQRELETVTLALVAMANAQRDARGDGAATVIESPPTVGLEPISDKRMMCVGVVGGGGLLLTIGAWLGLYRLLARSKLKFEKSLVVEVS